MIPKFRMWDNDMQEMLGVNALILEKNCSVIGRIIGSQPYLLDQNNDLHVLEDVVLMLYTGLKDKNGKEIYEGDIVKLTNENGWGCKAFVEYADGCFDVKFECFLYDRKLGIGRKRDYLKVFVANKAVAVIGNIYKNPELLEIPNE